MLTVVLLIKLGSTLSTIDGVKSFSSAPETPLRMTETELRIVSINSGYLFKQETINFNNLYQGGFKSDDLPEYYLGIAEIGILGETADQVGRDLFGFERNFDLHRNVFGLL